MIWSGTPTLHPYNNRMDAFWIGPKIAEFSNSFLVYFWSVSDKFCTHLTQNFLIRNSSREIYYNSFSQLPTTLAISYIFSSMVDSFCQPPGSSIFKRCTISLNSAAQTLYKTVYPFERNTLTSNSCIKRKPFIGSQWILIFVFTTSGPISQNTQKFKLLQRHLCAGPRTFHLVPVRFAFSRKT